MKKNKIKIIALTLFFNFASLQSATPFDKKLIRMHNKKTNNDKGFSLLKSLIQELPKHESHPNFEKTIKQLNARLKCHRKKPEYKVLFTILNILHIKRKGEQSHSRDLLIPHTALKKLQSRSTPVATTIATALAAQEAPIDIDLDRPIDLEEISELEFSLSLGSASSTHQTANFLLPPPLDTPLPTTTPTFQETEDEEAESTVAISSALRAKPARRSIKYQQLIEALEIDGIQSAQDIADKIPLIKEHHINDQNIRIIINKLINHMNKFFKEDPKYPEIFETLDALSGQIRRQRATIYSLTYRQKNKFKK